LKKKVNRLLSELLKDSKRSDRELSKILKTSQPTVSRMRQTLVRNGLIQEFTAIPDLTKLGFEILAISSFRTTESKEIAERAAQWTLSKPNVLFAARVEGTGRNGVMISIHKNYADYVNFIREVKNEGEGIIRDHDSLLISLDGPIVKPFSLKHLAELIEKSQD